MCDYAQWFATVTGIEDAPHGWQSQLGSTERCTNRLIHIPTGMGKTLGILSGWSYHRLFRNDDCWPRRLVWCLPMRVLVEQTADAARSVAARTRAAQSRRGVIFC